jgi:hypothetical protein
LVAVFFRFDALTVGTFLRAVLVCLAMFLTSWCVSDICMTPRQSCAVRGIAQAPCHPTVAANDAWSRVPNVAWVIQGARTPCTQQRIQHDSPGVV